MMSHTTAPPLMTIGAFSRSSRLSVKALRLYDQLGLLVPARIDADSGYRYYSADQVDRARLISLLRRLDMPLQRIAAVLDMSASEAVAELGRFWSEVEESVAVRRRLVAYLERHLEGRGETMYDVRTRQVPKQRALTIQRALTVEGLSDFIMESTGVLYTHVEKSGAKTAGPSFVIYHGEVNEDSDGPVEVCLPVDSDVDPVGEMTLRTEPAHTEAYTTITLQQCKFPGILEAYSAVEGWIQENGHEIAASPREVYFVEHSKIGPDDPFCDVAYPFR
jgi:DNA-binding transcriptional MerR regulator